MANAQILLYVVRPSEVPAEAFQTSVSMAARAAGLGLGAWTYSATRVTMVATDFGAVGRVSGGPFDGQEFTFSGAFTPGAYMLSAFRQNLGSTAGDSDSFADVSSSVRASLSGASTAIRSGFRTLRNRLSWDVDIPGAIPLAGEGSTGGIGWGILAAIGAGGLLIASRASASGSLKGLTKRRRRARR